ncbi:TetR/AcrR family transcriptional regulator [Pseudomonas sp.]|uniref:TetR/AcrR family transcriptional regulator n=1 Tax=Pseudomonas sp. TaxID=306 RepID=UPI002616AE2C|nr:TetR/AcrR family transcriptional regulator [Pseudomonas sp.]
MADTSNISRRRKAALADGSVEYKAKRDELVRVAAMLFKDKGYKATTLNDIAKAANLDRASVYYYIGSKDEFFKEVIKSSVDKNIAEVESLLRMRSLDPVQKLERLIELLMISYDECYPYMYVYIQEQMHIVAEEGTNWAQDMAQQTHRFEKAAMGLITQGIAKGLLRDDIVPVLAANAIFGMLNWTHRWHKPDGKYGAAEIAGTFSRIFFDGMRV